MSQIDQFQAGGTLQTDHRKSPASPLLLVELDPAGLVDGELLNDGDVAKEVRSFGRVREVCPTCQDVHLCLVLRQKNVKAEHLFCERCTRCFDACNPDGSSALAIA